MEIIDSHTHWGASVTLGIRVSTENLLEQAEKCGVDRIVVFPFPSQALAHEGVNGDILEECEKVGAFIPYYYIPEDLRPIPVEKGYRGGKWHWMRGIQDAASNYEVLKDPGLRDFIERSEAIDLPIIVEEELAFTRAFVDMTRTLKVIIPHLGMLGGDPMDFLDHFKDDENVHFDTALAAPSILAEFARRIGPERILFGSDVPFGTMERELQKVLSLPLGEEAKEKILGENLRRLIRME
ncbi:MAG: amidohydrolase family protein [Deltaproteobacteria bacterium]|nr:amidohydrolase family protein [Deltaproteobacteria bacterium]